MMLASTAALYVLLTRFGEPLQSAAVTLTQGMVITHSARITPRDYRLTSSQQLRKAGEELIPIFKPAIIIRGNNITVDFGKAVLRGTPENVDPDQRFGLGLLVEGNNITIRHLTARGYKVGLMASNCKGLRILDSDLSYNWKQRLLSTPERENEADWQSYHHNENNEWLRYGAGIYLQNCNAYTIQNTHITGGQCGLMLVRSTSGTVTSNNFSFLSGIGLGMYRSSRNRVVYNKLDWCVRGFSYGVYNRGQDSAGILIFEQSNNNLFAGNSVTHGGDGFFLWAGQSTMDNGKGGCNGNIVFGNDFSHSPCNGIETTFSSNTFVNNKLLECWHGIWGGYSFDSKIASNLFGFNGEAIAMEHGRSNAINHNLFVHENTAINLWQLPITDASWAYAKVHETSSADYQIAGNVFDGTTGPAISIRNTQRTLIGNNLFLNCKSAVKESGDNSGSKIDLGRVSPGDTIQKTISIGGQPVAGVSDNVFDYLKSFDIPWLPFANINRLRRKKARLSLAEQRVVDGGLFVNFDSKHNDPFLPQGSLRGQRYILVDQWGPYDFRSPRLVPRQILPKSSDTISRQRFEILGPKGSWNFVSQKGLLAMSESAGKVPGFVDVEFSTRRAALTELKLEYVGGSTTDYRGMVTPARKPIQFAYRRFSAPIAWKINFFKWDATNDPRTKPEAFKTLISGTPIKSLERSILDFAGASFDPSVGNDHYATVCDGTVTVPAGTYTLELTTDDGARVWVDDKPVITNAWKYQGPTAYTAKLKLDSKSHHIHVEHFQIDGYAALKVGLEPAVR